MKKSMIALAVLASFAGAAAAQSSVTLYGRAEVNATYSKPGDAVGGGDERWLMNDGGDNSGIGGSRWGLRGTEDLGSGLKAYFVLESGFRTDTGAAGDNAKFFNRQAYVALGSTSLGDVRLGRQETISRLINAGYTDASGIGELKVDEGVGGGRQLFQTFGQRVDNTATYITPNFGGFQVQAMVGAGEGANARYQGIMASYSAGPLKVAVGYEEYDSFGVFSDPYNKVINVGANYNFGFATLFAGYQDATDVGSNNVTAPLAATAVRDQQAWNVGVLVPIGVLQLRAQYTNVDYDLVSGAGADQQKYGVSVRYPLSKRTTLYSAVTQRDGENPGGVDATRNFTAKREITLLGVAHTF
ncbi:MAG TPA: porin [Methylibium sp.]|uniref:porin n=1 Tax=Methylibium sp. TaxID=2067992 RepID=UPI002DB65EE9|nr:porin [Methylibium sp.]HEU4459189.1 porin [Methylibium sp.]